MSNQDDRSSWRAIQQDSPVDAYMQSAPSFGGYEPFYPMPVGGNDNLDLFDVNFGLSSTGMKPEGKPLAKKGQSSGNGKQVLGKHKLYDQVAPPPQSYTGLNPKVDSYINSILAEGGAGELPAHVDQAEIISFLDSQFRVALDPLLISSVAAAAPPAPADASSPATKPKKKRKQSGLQDLEPEIERELSKFPPEEREKQRKVLKNRLAARTFRRRQKEHISEMASQIDSLSEENIKLKSALKLMAMENKMIKEQLGYIKSFLAPFGGVPGVMESARLSGSQPQQSPQHSQQHSQHSAQHSQQHSQHQQQPSSHSQQHSGYPSQYSQYGQQGYGGHNYNSFGSDFNDASNAQLLESYFNMENL